MPDIHLIGRYVGQTEKRILITCHSFYLIPQKCTSEKGMDGALQPSELVPPSLSAHGVDTKILEALAWKPTHLSILDSATGDLREYSFAYWRPVGPNGARFFYTDMQG